MALALLTYNVSVNRQVLLQRAPFELEEHLSMRIQLEEQQHYRTSSEPVRPLSQADEARFTEGCHSNRFDVSASSLAEDLTEFGLPDDYVCKKLDDRRFLAYRIGIARFGYEFNQPDQNLVKASRLERRSEANTRFAATLVSQLCVI